MHFKKFYFYTLVSTYMRYSCGYHSIVWINHCFPFFIFLFFNLLCKNKCSNLLLHQFQRNPIMIKQTKALVTFKTSTPDNFTEELKFLF